MIRLPKIKIQKIWQFLFYPILKLNCKRCGNEIEIEKERQSCSTPLNGANDSCPQEFKTWPSDVLFWTRGYWIARNILTAIFIITVSFTAIFTQTKQAFTSTLHSDSIEIYFSYPAVFSYFIGALFVTTWCIWINHSRKHSKRGDSAFILKIVRN